MRSISVSAAWAAGAAVSLMMATTTSLSAQQSDNPQTHPPVTVTVPSNPVAATWKRSHANPSRLVVACSGAFAKDSSHLKLTMTYDLNNIDFGEVDASSGKTMASIVFPKDPKRRLEVWWSDPNKRKDTYLIVINGSSTWAGPNGLRLGLSLLELEKLNGKPFKVRGFDKNKVAAVTDWNEGKLGALPGGCKAGVSLQPGPKSTADILAGLPSDREFSSTDPLLRAVIPAVSEILIGY